MAASLVFARQLSARARTYFGFHVTIHVRELIVRAVVRALASYHCVLNLNHGLGVIYNNT